LAAGAAFMRPAFAAFDPLATDIAVAEMLSNPAKLFAQHFQLVLETRHALFKITFVVRVPR
jgi:hypothetical protein